MKEKELERKAVDFMRQHNILAIKLVNPYQTGWPDRIIVPPAPHEIFFIEFKRLGGKPTKQQLRRHDIIRAQGKAVYVVDSLAALEESLRIQGVL